MIALLMLAGHAYGQGTVRGVVADVADSTVIGGALISVLPGAKRIVADEHGRFTLPREKTGSSITMVVSAIGVRDTITLSPSGDGLQWVLVRVGEQQLGDFVLHSMSAEEVARKAVSLIPVNYAATPYFCYSSYRQYQRMDSGYVNLVEARPVIMMNVSESKGRLLRSEAYANRIARRSYFVKEPWNAYELNATDLMSQDPVYHLEHGSLEPERFFHYTFSFDTVSGNDTNYVVHYRSGDYSSERHGIGNPGNPFPGESWEEGSIVIDRHSFAIRKFTRTAGRHLGYHYPRNNNFILPDRLYYVEFIDAIFIAEYVQMGERWYPRKLLHRFTNDCFGSGKAMMPDVRMTCYYEWQADSFSRFTGSDYAARFYNEMYMWPEAYEPAYWQGDKQPYYFTDSTQIFTGLEKYGPVESQFAANVKPVKTNKEAGERVPQSDR